MTFNKMQSESFEFFFAYHRGEWVWVPMLYIPKEAIGDDGQVHCHKLIPVDGQQLPEPSPKRSSDRAYQQIFLLTKQTILPWLLSDKEIKELCTRNDIPLAWITERFKRIARTSKSNDRGSRSNKRKCPPLRCSDYRKFINKLQSINSQSAIIAQILWFLNKSLQKGDDYITLEEVLRLQLRDVDPEDGITTCIRLRRSTTKGSHMVVHYLPKSIWKPLCKHIKEDSLFVFSNKNYGPQLSSDVNRHFREAGKAINLKNISSLSLRPIGKRDYLSNKDKTEKDSKNIELEEISAQEWQSLCHTIPSLLPNRGTRPKHDPRKIFNAILYQKRTGTPFTKLPSNFPSGKAIHSQYRRWRDKGIVNEVISKRKKNKAA